MRHGTVRSGLRWLAALACAAALGGCTAAASTGAFVPADRVEQDLRRGVSTKMDAQRVLGTPKGYGSMVFPQDRRELEVWYYADMALVNVVVPSPGVISADARMQVLLVTFDRGVFDGFVWFTNAGHVQSK